MRINVYAEELTDRVEVITKKVDGKTFYGIRLYLYLPVTARHENGDNYAMDNQLRGPFIHREGDDDSAAITFWVPWTKGKGNDFDALRNVFAALNMQLASLIETKLRGFEGAVARDKLLSLADYIERDTKLKTPGE